MNSSEYHFVLQALDKRYNALLQMYGEKVEQTQELSLDLQDMKDLYKSQVSYVHLPKNCRLLDI